MIADYENRRREAAKKLEAIQCDLFRDVVRFPFDEQTEHPQWKTSTVRDLAWTMFETNDFAAMPILADAFQDAGCEDAEMIAHCLRPAPHVRGCWVVDWILGKADL